MSGPQEPDPHQSWQPPGQVADHSSEPTMAAGSPWQHQQPHEGAWQAPAYTPQYQQPADPAYPQQYPSSPAGYGQPDFGSQATQFGPPPQFGPAGQYSQQPGPYGQPGQYGQYPPQFGPYGPVGKGSKRSVAVIGGVIGVIAVLFVGAILVLGFWQPGFFVTTKLSVSKANAGVQQVLTDETNGYGAKNVKDVKCNNGSDPTVKKGATFDCSVSIDGTAKHVTVTFQDNKGTYEVGRPQ